MKTKLLLGIFVASLLVFGSMPITGQTSGDPVEISFWYTENSSEAPGVLALVNEFEAANPDIVVNEEAKGFFSAKETYLTQFSAQLEPTVFRAARDWVVEFAQQGLIQPVSAFMNETEQADFLEDALRLVTYPDPNTGTEEIWGFPHLVDSPALFYNVELLEQAGVDTSNWNQSTSLTWDEFTSIAQQVWDHDYATETSDEPVYGFTFQGMFFGAQPAYYGHGATFFENDVVDYDNIDIDSPESREGLEFVKMVADAEYTPPWAEQGWETINPLFMNGRVAMVQQGPWEIANFLNNAPEFGGGEADDRPEYSSEDNLGIMRLPQDENGNTGAPLGGHAYVISTRAEGAVQEAAMRFAQFMSSAKALEDGAVDYYHVPVRQTVFDSIEAQITGNKSVDPRHDPSENGDVSAATEQIERAWKYIEAFKFIVDNSYENPVDHRWAQLETIFGNELDNYLSDEVTLDEFIAFVTSFWAEILVEGGAGGNADTSTEPFDAFAFMLALVAIPAFLHYRRRK